MADVANLRDLVPFLPLVPGVEVPCSATARDLVSNVVGYIPGPCAQQAGDNVRRLTVTGLLNGRRDAVHQAAPLEPLLFAPLTTGQTGSLVDQLIDAHGKPSGPG